MPSLIEIKVIGIFVAAALLLFTGWHLKSLSIAGAESKALIKEARIDYNQSGVFERTQADINKLYDNLNAKATYENSDNCPISASELQYLHNATHKIR